jgi:hypothetical protein
MKRIIITIIIGILILSSCVSLSADTNQSTTSIISNQDDDRYEDFNCNIRGKVNEVAFFDKSNNQRFLWDFLPIAYITKGKIAFGRFYQDLWTGQELEYPANGWLKIEGSKGSYLWEKNSFKGTIEKIFKTKNFRDNYYYIGATEFTGFKIGSFFDTRPFIIGYASHVKLGPYSPW